MIGLKRIVPFVLAFLIISSHVGIVNANGDVRQTYVDKTAASMIVVMNYHHFGYDGEYPQIDNIRISPEDFRHQLETLKAEGYTTISQAELIGYLNGTRKIPEKSLYITIDDGFKSTYTYAYPILKELGMTAALFPIISDVERGERLGAPMLTWEELREMAQSDVFTVGNHTYDLHWRKSDIEGKEAMIVGYNKSGRLLTKEKRRAMVYEDLVKAETVYKEQTGVAMEKAISYPFGAYDDIVLDVVAELGYEIGFTTTTGYHMLGAESTNLLEVRRYGISYRNTVEKLLQTLETSKDLASQKYAARNLRVMSHYDSRSDELRLTVSTTGGWTSVKSVQFEVWQVEQGQRTYVAPASIAEATLSEEAPNVRLNEKLAERAMYQKGQHYSMKVIMTNEDGSIDNEWVNFTY